MEKKTVARAIIILIFIALFVYVLLQYTNIFPEIYDPFSEKVRLVRNYACSMAICTRGCGDSMLSKRMCLERDPGTGGCKKWCQDICEENNWPDGKHCGENYQINLTLKSQVNLKGAYDIKGADEYSYEWDTEIEDIINFLNRTEHFTNLWDLLPFTSTPCTRRITPPYTAPDGGSSGWAWGFGLINWENAAFRWGGQWYSEISGGGDIILDPVEAHKLYNCFQKWPSTYNWDRATKRGYYSCEFTGSMRIWSFVDSYPEGCADVSFRAIEPPFAGDFVLWPEPDSRTIPLKNQDSFNIQITNSLGSDETFNLKTESIDGIDCTFEGDGTLYVENTKTNGITMTCSPTQFPPSGYGSYIVVITAEGGGKTRVTKVNVEVTDFSIDVKPDYSREAGVGEQLDYTVEIENKLGKTADFTVSILSPGVDCSFDNNDWSNVLDGEKRTDTMSCKPISGGTHDVTVKASYGPLEHNDTVEIVTPLCSVDSDGLKLKFFRGSSDVTEEGVYSGDDFTIQASGFSGCDNKFVDFYVNPGMHVSHQQVEPLGSECKIYKTAGTPGTYKFYAVMVVDGVEYKTSDTTLTIKKPDAITDECKKTDPWCAFSLGTVDCNGLLPGGGADICDKCGDYGSVGNCQNYGDPQSCNQDPKEGICAGASNICCIYDSDVYSPGPTDVSCLSPDTLTHNTGSNYFSWKGVSNARNVLVSDNHIDWNIATPVWERFSVATFNWNVFCGKDSDCNSPYFETECVEISDAGVPDQIKNNKACKVKGLDDNYWFTSWLYIKITDSSRPVYGIEIVSRPDLSLWNRKGSDGIWTDSSQKFELFLHNNNGWFHVDSPSFYTSYAAYWNFKYLDVFRPSNAWSWEKVDAILLANKYNFGERTDKWLNVNSWLDNSWIDYIGLLTKDSTKNTTFCTDGTGDYNRVVDDGKNCYWGLNCPIKNSEGWEWEGKSTVIGPLTDTNVGCDCTISGSCGNGYCEKSVGTDRFCYYGVKCMNGGWNGNIDKCEVGETCKYDGCS